MTVCTRCEGSGFINTHQIPEGFQSQEQVLQWVAKQTEPHDVSVCDCCGNGEEWYGEPGSHYRSEDPQGERGPYHYNGGFCECH